MASTGSQEVASRDSPPRVCTTPGGISALRSESEAFQACHSGQQVPPRHSCPEQRHPSPSTQYQRY